MNLQLGTILISEFSSLYRVGAEIHLFFFVLARCCEDGRRITSLRLLLSLASCVIARFVSSNARPPCLGYTDTLGYNTEHNPPWARTTENATRLPQHSPVVKLWTLVLHGARKLPDLLLVWTNWPTLSFSAYCCCCTHHHRPPCRGRRA